MTPTEIDNLLVDLKELTYDTLESKIALLESKKPSVQELHYLYCRWYKTNKSCLGSTGGRKFLLEKLARHLHSPANDAVLLYHGSNFYDLTPKQKLAYHEMRNIATSRENLFDLLKDHMDDKLKKFWESQKYSITNQWKSTK